jgi:hypothetical protein
VRETQTLIERVRQIGAGWQHLELAVEDPALEQIKPGQTLLVRPGTGWEPYLREQWVPVACDTEGGVLVVERPITQRYVPGDVASVIGPVGAPFPSRAGIRHLLLVVQDYPPTRLLLLLAQAVAQGVAVTMVLTGEAQQYPLGTLPPVVEVINNQEALQWPDQANHFTWADQVFAVTSPVYWEERYAALWEAARQARHTLPESFLYGVFDLPLPCGAGACLACMVRCKHDNRLVCVDGAAFDLAHVKLR